MSSCSANDAERFEGHLLACETCFQDLRTLDKAGSLMEEFLGSDRTAIRKVRRRLGRDSVQRRQA